MVRSRTRGVTEMQRSLRALPAEAQKAFVPPLEESGTELVTAMQAKAPNKTGKLRAGIKFKVYAAALRLVAGLIDTKAGRSDLFYGRIQDLGRKAQTVTVTRTRGGFAAALAAGKGRINAKTGKLQDTYTLRVKAMAGKKFVTGRYTDLRTNLRQRLSTAYDEAVKSAVEKGG